MSTPPTLFMGYGTLYVFDLRAKMRFTKLKFRLDTEQFSQLPKG